jgi:hypothetical protein
MVEVLLTNSLAIRSASPGTDAAKEICTKFVFLNYDKIPKIYKHMCIHIHTAYNQNVMLPDKKNPSKS